MPEWDEEDIGEMIAHKEKHGHLGSVNRECPAPGGETMTPEQEVDNLLREFQRACEAVVVRGDSNLSETTKLRAILRNDLRARLLSPSSTTATPNMNDMSAREDFVCGGREVLLERLRADALPSSRALSEEERAFIARVRAANAEVQRRLSQSIVGGASALNELSWAVEYIERMAKLIDRLTGAPK